MENHKHPIRLLALEHSPNDAERWVQLFRNAGFPPRVIPVSDLESFEQALDRQQWDIIISVEETPTLNAHQALLAIENNHLDIPVIVTLNEYLPNTVVKWLDAGAKDAILATSEQHILQAVLRELSALDIRRQLKSEQKKLTEANERCQLLLTSASEAIAYIHYGMHVDANHAYLELLGYENVDELAGVSLIDMATEESRSAIKQHLKDFQLSKPLSNFECQLTHHDGHVIPADIKLSEAQYDNEPCMQVTIRPVNVPILGQPIQGEQQVSSRDRMFNKAEELLQASAQVTLIWLQIDDYDLIRKTTNINGILSIQQNIAGIIREQLPDTTSCHYGDDVFLILDTNTHIDEMTNALHQLQSTIDNFLFDSDKETLTVSTTIGYATHNDSTELNGLITCAQTAFEHCIQDDDARIKKYSRSEEVRVKALDGDIKAKIEQALSDETLQVSFQPVISVTGTGDKHHFEMLVHIPAEDKEIIDIRSCMNTEELSGLMPLVDRWTLRKGMLELTRKQKEGMTPRLIIQISQWSIQDPKFIPYLINLFKATKLPADSIVLQLPETVALQQLKGLVEFSRQIEKTGSLLSINDFKGDSRSFKILQHVNLHLVQLEPKFTKMLGKSKAPQLEAVLNNLGNNNTHCAAVNIVNSQAIAHLWQVGIEFAKGEYIGHPSKTLDYDFG